MLSKIRLCCENSSHARKNLCVQAILIFLWYFKFVGDILSKILVSLSPINVRLKINPFCLFEIAQLLNFIADILD